MSFAFLGVLFLLGLHRLAEAVFDLERRWATPVPCVTDLAELNAHLRRCCLAESDRVSGAHTEPVSGTGSSVSRAVGCRLAGLAYLKELIKLELLSLKDTGVTDDGLVYVKGLPVALTVAPLAM